MTIQEVLDTSLREPIMAVIMVLLTIQMFLFFSAIRDGRSIKVRLAHILHFLLTFCLFYLLVMDTFLEGCRICGSETAAAVHSAFVRLPVSFVIACEILTGCVLAAGFLDLLIYRKSHPTYDSIKEAMDLLPAGIAFAEADGTVVFRNLAMSDLARKLTGKRLTDITALQRAVDEKTQRRTGNTVQVSLPEEGGVWQLSADRTEVDGRPCVRLAATDITEEAAIARELEEKNKKLRDIHMRLDIYNRQADRIVIAQELLTARMAVHNELGSILLESRHYLNDPSSIDEEVLLQALKNTNTYLLREYEEDDTAGDPLVDAFDLAGAIGVRVEVAGSIPAEGTAREILAAAVSECATNTVKHADGDSLSVKILTDGEDVTFVFQSSGTKPTEEIRETGGLFSLRTLVEKEQGTMEVESIPEFRLIIRLKDAGAQPE